MFVTGIKSLRPLLRRRVGLRQRGRDERVALRRLRRPAVQPANLDDVNQWVLVRRAAHEPRAPAAQARARRGRRQRRRLHRLPQRSSSTSTAAARTRSRSTARRPPTTASCAAAREALHPRRLAPVPLQQVPLRGRGRDDLRLDRELARRRATTRRPDSSIRQFGLATQSEFRAVEDKLRIQFGFGWASGDPDVEGLAPGPNGLQPRQSDGRDLDLPVPPGLPGRLHPLPQHPDARAGRVLLPPERRVRLHPQPERPEASAAAPRSSGAARASSSRRPATSATSASSSTLQIYYQSKDGTLNDDPNKMGGFYTTLQYGVFFPLGGLDYLPGETQDTLRRTPDCEPLDGADRAAHPRRLVLIEQW